MASVTLNEIFPNPSGDSTENSEFIELYNTSDDEVSIAGWILDDIENGGSHPFLVASGSALAPHSFQLFEKSQTGISLNNGGDTVRLLSPDNSVLDTYTYSQSTEDQSIGRSQDGTGNFASCASRTPGISNDCLQPSPTTQVQPYPTITEKPPTPKPTNTIAKIPSIVPTPLPTIQVSDSQIPAQFPTTDSEDFHVLGLVDDIAASFSSIPISSHSTASAVRASRSNKPIIIGLLMTGIGFALLAVTSIIRKQVARKAIGQS